MRRARELESLFLAMFAAVPLYFTYSVKLGPLIVFHVVLAAIGVRVAFGKGPELLPARLMRWLAIAYIPIYFVDWRFISHSAIAASTHLVLFIAIYQPIEALQRDNKAQRLLTASLIFVASIATSTHISILPFILAFAFLMFRQLMYVSHLESVRSTETAYVDVPAGRTAGFYVIGAAAIASVLFPLMPRVRNPLVQSFTGPLPNSATGLSQTINFDEPRVSSTDATVVSRVWLDRHARVTIDAIRLRGMLYDRYERGEWRQTYHGFRLIPPEAGVLTIATRKGVQGRAIVQQRPQRGKLFLPVGTFAVSGIPARLFEGPTQDAYHVYYDGMLTMSAHMAYQSEPLRVTRVAAPQYPVTPEIAALARRIAGAETTPTARAARIERYLSTNYRYVPNPANLGKTISVDDFLLRERAGHCEYFAAGMVALLAALDTPARIAGGYYGGRYNPLTGYYVFRRSDAHAWTEVWDGTRWVTFDSTPAALRPGAQTGGAIREYLAALSDSVNFVWDRYILTFGLGDQIALFEDMLTRGRAALVSMRQKWSADALKVGAPRYATITALLVAVGLLTILIARRRRPLFYVLADYLAARGIEVGPAMTMEEALDELRARQPDAARELAPLIALYEEERFSEKRDRNRAASIRRRLAEIPRSPATR